MLLVVSCKSGSVQVFLLTFFKVSFVRDGGQWMQWCNIISILSMTGGLSSWSLVDASLL